MTKEEQTMVRDLIVTLEYLRSACELSDGKRKRDDVFLTCGMSAGIRTLEKYRHLTPDYGKQSYWDEVWAKGNK